MTIKRMSVVLVLAVSIGFVVSAATPHDARAKTIMELNKELREAKDKLKKNLETIENWKKVRTTAEQQIHQAEYLKKNLEDEGKRIIPKKIEENSRAPRPRTPAVEQELKDLTQKLADNAKDQADQDRIIALKKAEIKDADANQPKEEAKTKALQDDADRIRQERAPLVKALKSHMQCYGLMASMEIFATEPVSDPGAVTSRAQTIANKVSSKLQQEMNRYVGTNDSKDPAQDLTDAGRDAIVKDGMRAAARHFFGRIRTEVDRASKENPAFSSTERASLLEVFEKPKDGLKDRYEGAVAALRADPNRDCDHLRQVLEDAEKFFWRTYKTGNVADNQLTMHHPPEPRCETCPADED